MKSLHLLFSAFLLAGALATADAGGTESQTDNPQRRWAEPVSLCQPENVYKISDVLYRGGHVTRAGAEQLRCLGIKTVVSFRVVGRDVRFASRAGMNAVQFPFQAWQPDEDQVIEFLKIATDPACQPVYFACYHGADRAGMMCAVYRVAVEGWSKEEALCEMIEGPYGYNPIWKKVVQFVRDMDVERIRCRAGLK